MENKLSIGKLEALMDASFWKALSLKKIDEWKLDSDIKHVFGSYQSTKFNIMNTKIDINGLSFKRPKINQFGPYTVHLRGDLKLFNTVEEYKTCDLKKFYDNARERNNKVLKDCKEKGSIDMSEFGLNCSHFLLIIFGDLKKYIFSVKFIDLGLRFENDTVLEVTENSHEEFNSVIKNKTELITKIGPLCHNSGFFTIGDTITQIFTKENQTNLVGFVDSVPVSDKINPILFHYIEAVREVTEMDSFTIYSFKDFMGKQNMKPPSFLKSISYKINFWSSKMVPLDLNSVVENKFNLKDIIDEKELSNQAVDLNIKLMRWREKPGLDLDLIYATKCLLLGAGTLGCQVARNLIGWGFRNITFVDYGSVSHSNPVRQSLYNYEDAIYGGKMKAKTAAENLSKIQPGIKSKGYNIKIPMPGHQINKDELPKILEDVKKIEELIIDHHVVFLLLDTREARWLGTLLASVHNKICISVGLGFDNYVIIRHGIGPLAYDKDKHGERSGCYFCNDYLSPGNTMKDRTLDQQCTVTRPGLSFISSAYASELLVNYLHAKPSDLKDGKMEETSMGKIPQHIRGNTGLFETQVMYSTAFDSCLGCGKNVVEEYLKDKDQFISTVLTTPDYLQDASGIKECLFGGDIDLSDGGIIVIEDDF